jgi:cytochrome c-type protein NapB
MKKTNHFIPVALLIFGTTLFADTPLTGVADNGLANGLRGTTPLDQQAKSPAMARTENTDVRRKRNYTDQPPTIPHKIDGYEITQNVNKCMMCHSRQRTEEFQAPMVSATHFMNRDYDYLAQISPRRYFCTQCHVVQTDAKPPITNTFEDVDEIIARKAKQAKPK